MFDINTIINTAIAAAVAEATKPLLERIETMEKTMVESTIALAVRCTALEAKPVEPLVVDEAKMVEALNSQEWFWEKLTSKAKEVADAAAEAAIDEHCQNYDHDDYDRTSSAVDDLDLDDLVSRDDMRDTVHDLLSDATFRVRVEF